MSTVDISGLRFHISYLFVGVYRVLTLGHGPFASP